MMCLFNLLVSSFLHHWRLILFGPWSKAPVGRSSTGVHVHTPLQRVFLAPRFRGRGLLCCLAPKEAHLGPAQHRQRGSGASPFVDQVHWWHAEQPFYVLCAQAKFSGGTGPLLLVLAEVSIAPFQDGDGRIRHDTASAFALLLHGTQISRGLLHTLGLAANFSFFFLEACANAWRKYRPKPEELSHLVTCCPTTD